MREIKHLSVHQWLRPAIPDSQQPTSPIGFLFLKLPPPPCAVLLVKECKTIGLTPTRQDFEKHGWTITRDSDLLFFPLFCPRFFLVSYVFPSFSNFVIFSKFSRYFCTFSIFQLSQISEFMFVCFHFSRFLPFMFLYFPIFFW